MFRGRVRSIPKRNPQGGGGDISSFLGEKVWGQKEMFVKYRDDKKTWGLPLTWGKNGETNKIVCI